MICTEQVDHDIQLLPVWNCQNHINKHLSRWIIFGANANTAKILAMELWFTGKQNNTDVLLHQDSADAS